ncbi:uncharacterized protein [Nicotiana sylvestris]|uniref:uncharacterized protein isoform X3 n=1 Tax=Nicotiana sylvestris TaxID=4096 RepID=UPI00388C42CD
MAKKMEFYMLEEYSNNTQLTNSSSLRLKVVILLGESISCQPEQQEKNVKGAEEKCLLERWGCGSIRSFLRIENICWC